MQCMSHHLHRNMMPSSRNHRFDWRARAIHHLSRGLCSVKPTTIVQSPPLPKHVCKHADLAEALGDKQVSGIVGSVKQSNKNDVFLGGSCIGVLLPNLPCAASCSRAFLRWLLRAPHLFFSAFSLGVAFPYPPPAGGASFGL